jgi:hypothetical protein
MDWAWLIILIGRAQLGLEVVIVRHWFQLNQIIYDKINTGDNNIII